jgi:hypothetical protein
MDNNRGLMCKMHNSHDILSCIKFNPQVYQMPFSTLRTKGDQVVCLKETHSKIRTGKYQLKMLHARHRRPAALAGT